MNPKGTEEKRLNWDRSDETKDKTAKHLQSHSPAKPCKISLNATFLFLFGKNNNSYNFLPVKYPSFGTQSISRLHQTFILGIIGPLWTAHKCLENCWLVWCLNMKHFFVQFITTIFRCNTKKQVVNSILWAQGQHWLQTINVFNAIRSTHC